MFAFLNSLRTRLVLLLLLAMLPALGLILYSGLEQRHLVRNGVQRDLLKEARRISDVTEDYILQGQIILNTLAQMPAFQVLDKQASEQILARVQKEAINYTDYFAASPDGQVFASTAAVKEPVNLADRPYFQKVLQTSGFAVGKYQIGRISGRAIIPLAQPVLNPAGHLVAVVGAGMDLGWISETLKKQRGPAGAVIYLIDRHATVLARYPEDSGVVGKSLPETPIMKEILARNEGVVETTGPTGLKGLFGFTALGQRGYGLYVTWGLPVEAAYAPVNRALWFNLLLLAEVAFMVVVVMWLMGNRFIVRPVHRLMEVTQRMAQGDLGARFGQAVGMDEIAQLGRSFDAMAVSLEERDTAKARAEEALRRAYEGLELQVQERTRELTEVVERLNRSNLDLQQFAYVASHDLQEPLRMVSSFTQMLARRYQGRLDQEADEFMHYIVDGSDRMQRLINDLLVFCRVESRGKEPARVNTEAVLRQVLDNLSVRIAENEAEITHDPLPKVWADETQLAQLFQNLLSNAIKFRREDPPRIHISAVRQGGEWFFGIKDNGIGIDPQYYERIFIIFQRLHGREEHPGTGIGLAVCKRIVERHGGRIWVESKPGQGSTFYFTLPYQRSKEGTDAETRKSRTAI